MARKHRSDGINIPQHVLDYAANQREMHRAILRLIDGKVPEPERSVLITQLEIYSAIGILTEEIGNKAAEFGPEEVSAETTITLSQLPTRMHFRLSVTSEDER